jgi:hypothetical protein
VRCQQSKKAVQLNGFFVAAYFAIQQFSGSGFGCALRHYGRRITHLQVIVFGKVDAKIPCHYVVIAQIAVDDDAFCLTDRSGNAPRRVAQMAAGLGATGAKLTHDTSQTLSPITWAKRLTLVGNAQDVTFFGGGGCHQLDSSAALQQNSN